MKITVCAYDSKGNVDGPSSWLKRLLPFLRSNGIETRLLFLAATQPGLRVLGHFQEAGYACKLIPDELFFEEQVLAIVRDLDEHPPDIFVPNYFPVASSCCRFTNQAGIPSVLVLHNDNDYHHALVERFVRGPVEDRVSAVVSVSQAVAGLTARGLPTSVKSYTIPYGSPIPERPVTWRADSEELGLVYLGRLNNEQKRISDVARALCRASNEVPGVNATIYGSGDALPEVQQILSRESRGRVQYGGMVKHEDVFSVLSKHHVFVLLSDFEGIPIALMEAMGTGLVPICTDIKSGIPELVDDQVTGLLVDNRGDAFVSAVRSLKASPEKWNRISEVARAKIRDAFSIDRSNERWLQLFRELKVDRARKPLEAPNLEELSALELNPVLERCQTRSPRGWRKWMCRLRKSAGVAYRRLGG